ncbi:ATP-binding protein [Mycobacterium sp. IDR2000157661]|uniref:ATP-binding protein n=1 Tax=Mycobacterium sp. IDR2000157661 TaxID=2867005 RepID=UPI001EECAFA6|nr:adenylate/guanylate cyclase domain-containing protein [Mycobacterium sp. IDR2000157661]ULE33794.1 AAA family ATPase [Mycobacterium sp. IDR2000157661]
MIDDLLDRAVRAMNRGDRATADRLAGQVLAVDHSNAEAEELLAAPADGGEIRRLTMLFADLVDSTALSTRIEPEVYRTVVGRYRDEVLKIVNRYEGHVGNTKGDGLLAVFGHPRPHENDAHRAVQAGLDITREVATLSERVRARFGFDISVRVGIHLGLVYLDTAQDDVYGFGANLAARMCSLAAPGTVAVSETIERVVKSSFEFEELPPKSVKGVDGPVIHHRVVAEREVTESARGPLVGRRSELAKLETSWAEAAAGTLATRGIAILGEGGVGKTRLAQAAVDMAEQTGATVLTFFGSPLHIDVGLRPIRRMLERRCGISRDTDPPDRLDRLRDEIERRSLEPGEVLPLLAPVLGIAPESGYLPVLAGGTRLYEQIAEGIDQYFQASLQPGPALVVAEDIHWFDEDTIEFVQKLLRTNRNDLLVIVTGRRLPPLEGAHVIELVPLSDSEADELVRDLHPSVTPDARRAVLQRCDGMPLYIEEVVAKLKEQPSDTAQTMVPDSLYETLCARLRSSSHAPQVVEAAALIGSRFDRRLLASVVSLNEPDINDAIRELTSERVLTPVDANSWRFHHELLREVAAELSPPSVRRRMHGRIADALVGATPEGTPEWPLVAHHYEQAERFDAAASAYQQASVDARQRGALGEARVHLTRALENIEKLPATPERDLREVPIRLQRGFLASAATGHASIEAASEFERCLQILGDKASLELFATFSALWSYYATRGDLDRATQVVEALRMRLDDMPVWYRTANTAALGSLAVFRGDFRGAREPLEAAASALDQAGPIEIEGAWFAPNDPLASTYTYAAFTRFISGDLVGAEAAFAEMENRCEMLPFPHGPFTLCYGRTIEALMRTEAGQHDRAIELVDEVVGWGHEYGFDEWVMVGASAAAVARAIASVDGGETDAATLQVHIDVLTAVVDGWRAADMKAFLGWYDSALARTLAAAGATDAARQRLDMARRMAEETGWRIYDAELLRLRARLSDDPVARRQDLAAAKELAQHQGALIYELRAAVDDFELRADPAREALASVLRRFPQDQDWPELARARALLR